MFHEWEAVNDDPMKLIWQTNNPEHLSQLVRLEKLGGKGFGCAKLLNARASKPSETVMLVVPPALAILKTAKGSNDRVLIVTFHLAMLHEVQHAPLIPLVPPTTAQLCVLLFAVQDGTFVLCTSHEKKGYLPAFQGYSREKEQQLNDFAECEVMNLLHHKKLARYLSPNLIQLVDPDFEMPPTPRGRKKPKKKVVPPKAVAAAKAPRSPSPESSPPVREVPASPASPFSARSKRRTPPAKSPPVQSNNLEDFQSFWDDDDED